MNNVYSKIEYKEIIVALKAELKKVRQQLDETDVKYPRIQKIIDQHWND